jgi:hypothetical protein
VGGNILSSKKRSYAHLLEHDLKDDVLEDAVRAMMQEQHKEMLRELKQGKYDHLNIGSSDTHLPIDSATEQEVCIKKSDNTLFVDSDEHKLIAISDSQESLFAHNPLAGTDERPAAITTNILTNSEQHGSSSEIESVRSSMSARRSRIRERPAFATPPPLSAASSINSTDLLQSPELETVISASSGVNDSIGSNGSLSELDERESSTVPDLPVFLASSEIPNATADPSIDNIRSTEHNSSQSQLNSSDLNPTSHSSMSIEDSSSLPHRIADQTGRELHNKRISMRNRRPVLEFKPPTAPPLSHPLPASQPISTSSEQSKESLDISPIAPTLFSIAPFFMAQNVEDSSHKTDINSEPLDLQRQNLNIFKNSDTPKRKVLSEQSSEQILHTWLEFRTEEREKTRPLPILRRDASVRVIVKPQL